MEHSYNAHALCIGLNHVNPAKYSGWSGKLNACENDAKDMAWLAKHFDIEDKNITTLLSKQATGQAVVDCIIEKKDVLKKGDLFFLTYSGHGGQVKDLSGDELDHLDETWCLYDGQLVDDVLYSLLSTFDKGVKIVILSDSCHSGTMFKSEISNLESKNTTSQFKAKPAGIKGDLSTLSLPMFVTRSRIIDNNILLISGCQDNQFSMDGVKNGKFTGTLLNVINRFGNNKYNYEVLHRTIVRKMPPTQTPNLIRSFFYKESFLSF